MNFTQPLCYQRVLAGTLVALLSSAIGLPSISGKAEAQSFGSPTGSSRGGGVRGQCFVTDRERPLIAIVDQSNPGLTTQANPTFLFYTPYSQSSEQNKAITAEFELLDENEKPVLKTERIVFSLPEKPGIVKVTVPNTETTLEPDKAYFWIFRVNCDANDSSANPSVSGWIKRVKAGSSENLWFDRLAQLTQSPMNHLDQWTQLLKEVDPKLQDLAQTPIVELKPNQ
ncbi:DUF928 domain-containing protein [Aerosakkonemataceae cyanobacterium BLCC-F50]|uniref:DUF928 domain-containing protein n=1 Tax=Floridaenema flaviceps BLCC-F50 TaxID=3153642 RepID=A0ABV4XNS5_9CYAN